MKGIASEPSLNTHLQNECFMNNDLKSSTRYVLGLFAVDNIKISDFGMSVIRRIDSGEITIAEGKQLIVNEAKN